MGTFQLRKAERKKVKLKLGVSGPSGSGKTYSSLLLAYGMTGSWEKITLIDTENGSGELYSSLGPYNVISFEAPYSPQRYVEAIDAALQGGAEVIVIDSISHEWDGKGGCLDIQTQLGGRYQDWARVTPMHNAFVDKILHSPCHVIVTTRKKQDYEMTKDSSGKAKVQKMGMKEIQRDGFEYELTINFDVEINHFATASKDRTGIFMPKGPFQITPDTGKELLAWSESGASAKPVESPKLAATTKETTTSTTTMELNHTKTSGVDTLEEAKRNTRKLLVLKKNSKELLFAIEKKLGKKIAEFNEQDFNEFTKELENGN
jgi:AAA domain